MSQTLEQTNFQFPEQSNLYHGKVRDVYSIGEEKLIMIATDRISAFDHVLPKAIPFKGQVLNQIAAHFLRQTTDILPNWVESIPDPNVTIGKRCDAFKIEMVIRGFLCGHAWREYNSGRRMICGVEMPEGMNENDPFLKPIITPATKADEGHDEDISKREILERGIVSEEDYSQLEKFTAQLFERGSKLAEEQGLILVDTKYEFGKVDGKIYLIDEIHTPDSSRYFYKEGFQDRQKSGQKQKQLSKEFVREWLIENNFQGLDGQLMPEMPDEFVQQVSERYIELYEQITGTKFQKAETEDITNRIEKNIIVALS